MWVVLARASTQGVTHTLTCVNSKRSIVHLFDATEDQRGRVARTAECPPNPRWWYTSLLQISWYNLVHAVFMARLRCECGSSEKALRGTR